MLDFDLAELYQVETKRLKEAVRRNIERFEGDDFMFELSESEYNALKDRLRSQIASLEIDGRGKYPKYPPFAFTEMGVAMLSSVLRSETAIRVNRAIMGFCSNAQLHYHHNSDNGRTGRNPGKTGTTGASRRRQCRSGQ